MNILTVNSNGLGKGDFKAPLIRKLVEKYKVDFLGIQESKRKNISNMTLKSIWGSHDFEAVIQDANGQGGGLISMWNKSLFHRTQAITRQDCIVIIGVLMETNEVIITINVYASQNPEARREQRYFLNSILENRNHKKIIFGDFNEVRNEEERRGSAFDARGANSFNNFIQTNDL